MRGSQYNIPYKSKIFLKEKPVVHLELDFMNKDIPEDESAI